MKKIKVSLLIIFLLQNCVFSMTQKQVRITALKITAAVGALLTYPLYRKIKNAEEHYQFYKKSGGTHRCAQYNTPYYGCSYYELKKFCEYSLGALALTNVFMRRLNQALTARGHIKSAQILLKARDHDLIAIIKDKNNFIRTIDHRYIQYEYPLFEGFKDVRTLYNSSQQAASYLETAQTIADITGEQKKTCELLMKDLNKDYFNTIKEAMLELKKQPNYLAQKSKAQEEIDRFYKNNSGSSG